MSVAAGTRPNSLRDVPWATWALLVLGGLVVLFSLVHGTGLRLATLIFVAPIFFAAAVRYAAPPDRRFVWAALLLAVTPVVGAISAWLPNFWFDTAPGDWKNATPLLMELGSMATEIARVLGYVGLGLLGLALGGVRSLAALVIIGVGALFAIVNAIAFLANPIEGMPIDVTVSSIVFPTLYIVGWAFVFAAALESRRTLMLAGTGLIFAEIIFDRFQVWWLALPPDLVGVLFIATAALSLFGWALMIVSALRGELNAANPRTAGEPAA